MKHFKRAFTLAELPEAGQYMSKRELSAVAKELPEAGQYMSKCELSAVAKELPEARQHRSKQAAFTLAEVLITLGIIGIVAAMTIPTLMSHQRKIEVETKLKNFYTTFNQAVRMAQSEFGDIPDWMIDCSLINCTYEVSSAWFNEHLGKYIKNLGIEQVDGSQDFYVYLPDGSVVRMEADIMDLHYYTNKKALDNPIGGVNSFMFRFNPVLKNNQKATATATVNGYYVIQPGFEPYKQYWDGTRELLLGEGSSYTATHFGCKVENSHGGYCAALIQYDGWKIAKDYPKKF